MIKKVVLDRADRLYHFPFDIEDFLPKRSLKAGENKIPTIDLARFQWKVSETDWSNTAGTKPATPDDLEPLKELLADWLEDEYKVKVNPRKEIYVGQGIHRIIFDLIMAYVEYGDIVLCPEPGMPFYKRLVIAAGGVPVNYPVFTRSDFKPSVSSIDSNLGKAAKIMILNNPNNPTGILHDEIELDKIIRIASRQNVFIINDAAYCSLSEDKYKLIRAIPGGSKVALEVFSIPFTFGLSYVPFGFAVGPVEVISAMETIGRTISPVIPFSWIDNAIVAINNYPSKGLREINKRIDQTRLSAEHFILQSKWEIIGGKSCPFSWVKIPERNHSSSYASTLLRKKKLLTLPGTAFGETCDGYLRLSLTASPEDYEEAGKRMSRKFSLLRGDNDPDNRE